MRYFLPLFPKTKTTKIFLLTNLLKKINMRTITYNVYTISEHPNKEAVYKYIRENDFFDLGDFDRSDLVSSLEALATKLGGWVDYSFGAYPDRNEHITFYNIDVELLNSLDTENCILTGCYWDNLVIESVKNNNTQALINEVHENNSFYYEDDQLFEHCEANNYEFFENGKFFG